MADLRKLYDAVLNGDAKTAVAVTREALDEDMDPIELISGTMVPAMDEVGKLYEEEEYFVPELLLSARAMKGALVAPPAPGRARSEADRDRRDRHGEGRPPRHRQEPRGVVARGGGFEVIDLGADVVPERFIEAVREKGAQIVCLSALLTVTMASMRSTIDALREAGMRDRVKVLVGGAPVTQQYADEIGADGYGENASVAVALARRFCGTAAATLP